MGVSALARRAAPASRARMPGSLSSRRWPTAPPWRRAPATSDVPICTLSSLGSRRVREEFKRPSRPGSQPTSRTGQHTRGRTHAPPRRPPRARSRSAPPEQRALGCGRFLQPPGRDSAPQNCPPAAYSTASQPLPPPQGLYCGHIAPPPTGSRAGARRARLGARTARKVQRVLPPGRLKAAGRQYSPRKARAPAALAAAPAAAALAAAALAGENPPLSP